MENARSILRALAFVTTLSGCNGSDNAAGSADGAAGPTDGAAAPPVGCEAEAADASAYKPTIDPANYVATVDNKFFPLVPGTDFQTIDADGNVSDFTVTNETKVILGVTCIVVHDVSKTKTGDLIEDTHDWFAQDKDGNVWYFGEDTAEYTNGKVSSTAGSWTAGVNCARPGIIMEASPKVGDNYREEYYKNEAEDEAKVLSLTEHVEVPYAPSGAGPGTFDNCLETENFTKLEPGNVEHKWYCAGIGQTLAEEVVMVGTGKKEQLVAITKM